jgi:hypothetical protein
VTTVYEYGAKVPQSIVGSNGTGPAGKEQIKELGHRWLSRYVMEIREYLLQVKKMAWKWSQCGSIDIVGSYETGPAVEEEIKEAEHTWLSRYGKEIRDCLLHIRHKER